MHLGQKIERFFLSQFKFYTNQLVKCLECGVWQLGIKFHKFILGILYKLQREICRLSSNNQDASSFVLINKFIINICIYYLAVTDIGNIFSRIRKFTGKINGIKESNYCILLSTFRLFRK